MDLNFKGIFYEQVKGLLNYDKELKTLLTFQTPSRSPVFPTLKISLSEGGVPWSREIIYSGPKVTKIAANYWKKSLFFLTCHRDMVSTNKVRKLFQILRKTNIL